MAPCAPLRHLRILLASASLFCAAATLHAADARFDLVGPRIDVRVTRNGESLPIAAVPNLKAGDKLWVHPDLPPSQSVKYLLICVFLRGTTNPPPEDWFIRIETWSKPVREEGAMITVPAEAQQALLFLAPETGGDFSTLRSAVRGRPGAFVRASQDLSLAGFEQARIEKYIASIRRVPPGDSAALQQHSNFLASTLALKPNIECFKQPVDTQFTCLTQSGTQVVLDDGHGQNLVAALSNGPGSDLISQASYTQLAGGGLYSAYVGAIVDVVRLLGNLHTAQYQYIPAIAFPQGQSLNLRLNTPPSFHNPKSVLVIGLPAIQEATPPPLRPADPNEVVCLLNPDVVIPVVGAPLVFSTDFAHDLVLHLNTPPGAPAERDIPLTPDAYAGGLLPDRTASHRTPLRDDPAGPPVQPVRLNNSSPAPTGSQSAGKPAEAPKPRPEPVLLTGTVEGRWGFESFTGPTVTLQQKPGTDWSIVADDNSAHLITGHSDRLLITSTGTACVHTITARPSGVASDLNIPFKAAPEPDGRNRLALNVPLEREVTPGDLHLQIQQYDQPRADQLSAHTYTEPANIAAVEFHAGDRSVLLTGTHLDEIVRVNIGDLVFSPGPPPSLDGAESGTPRDLNEPAARFFLPAEAPRPSTHAGEHLSAKLALGDGRHIEVPLVVASARPVVTLLRKTVEPPAPDAITLSNPDDLPLSARVDFTLKSAIPFPRNGEVEVETTDGTLRAVLTLAPSGGLVLQDPHTVVASLDPLRSFGPSAFGSLHVRAVFPPVSRPDEAPAAATPANTPPAKSLTSAPVSDWLPLGSLVRLPVFTQVQCPPDAAAPCTLTGHDLYLLESVSTDPAFASPVAVPDGYTGTVLQIPRPSAATLFLKLRDDPGPINSALLPGPLPGAATHAHSAGRAAHPEMTTPAKQESPAPAAPAPSSPVAIKPS